jgi:phage shock protein C
MIATNPESDRHFYRDRDRAVLGGVCAGLADYLGFNLKVTRCLAFIAFLMAMPIAIIAYLAAVFLIPSESRRGRDTEADGYCGKRKRRKYKKEKQNIESPKPPVAEHINQRCESLDERLKRLEKHVTSKRYQLDQELSRL